MLVFLFFFGVVVSCLFDFYFCFMVFVIILKNWMESGVRKVYLSEMLFFLFVVKDIKFELFLF